MTDFELSQAKLFHLSWTPNKSTEQPLAQQKKHCVRLSQSAGAVRNSEKEWYPPPKESDEKIDLDELIASLKSSSAAKYQPVPEDLQLLINKLCSKYSVVDPIWTPSPTDSKVIYIHGKGVGMIRNELEAKFPSFKFRLEESGPLHTKQIDK